MEMYQAFMAGYVRRINQATLNVTIGGIRIGTAKYTRLAQINLKSGIITFSKFAIENVPERGRRYLVLHELAHVKEASHNRNFWEIVERYEPNYKQMGHALDLAFKRNVKEDQQRISHAKVVNPLSGRLEEPKLLVGSRLMNYKLSELDVMQTNFAPDCEEEVAESFECMEDEFEAWDGEFAGTIHGGADVPIFNGGQLSPVSV
jgi:hypothetical protein